MLNTQLNEMNLGEAVDSVGASDVYIGKGRKSPEDSWEPAGLRGRSQPRVVLEVGLTECCAAVVALCSWMVGDSGLASQRGYYHDC